jgi:hypothetical protein
VGYYDPPHVVARGMVNGKQICCHRYLLNAKEEEKVDHRDGTSLLADGLFGNLLKKTLIPNLEMPLFQ